MAERRTIVTIGRQYGSGGREVGAKLAEQLGFGFYDKNILRMNSEESGIKESYFHLADEKAGDNLLYRIVSNLKPEAGQPSFRSDLTSADNLFRFQSEVIRKLAQEESCVIIGRCADYILAGTEGLLRVFVYADMDYRIRRITGLGYYEPKDVEKNIRKMDRERLEYHRYFTGQNWEDMKNYDLMINTSVLGVDGAVNVIRGYLDLRNRQ